MNKPKIPESKSLTKLEKESEMREPWRWLQNSFTEIIEQKRGALEQELAFAVEMISSQGCTTSRSAEMVLSRLGRGDFELEVPVVVLAFHVDYWDYMGWKNPLGSSQWTVTQKAYVEALGLDIFTPQVVAQAGPIVLDMMKMPSSIPSPRLLDPLLLPSRVATFNF